MLTNEQRAFLRAYASISCSSVAEALAESGQGAEDYRGMASDPDFVREMHSMLSSLEAAPPPDPFDFAPEPPVTCAFASIALAIDPLGPLHGSFAYDHSTRRFTDGKRMSELLPGDVEWFNTAANWKGAGG